MYNAVETLHNTDSSSSNGCSQIVLAVMAHNRDTPAFGFLILAQGEICGMGKVFSLIFCCQTVRLCHLVICKTDS